MRAENVDLSPLIAEERPDPGFHAREWSLSCTATLCPICIGNDKEEVLSIGGDVRLPHVLKVMVVGRCASPLDLSEHSATLAQAIEEVRASTGDEARLWSQHDLFPETELAAKQLGNDYLNGTAGRTMDVDTIDVCRGRGQVRPKSLRQPIDLGDLSRFVEI